MVQLHRKLYVQTEDIFKALSLFFLFSWQFFIIWGLNACNLFCLFVRPSGNTHQSKDISEQLGHTVQQVIIKKETELLYVFKGIEHLKATIPMYRLLDDILKGVKGDTKQRCGSDKSCWKGEY